MHDGLLFAVVPFEGYAGPALLDDSALVLFVLAPANAGADVKRS